MKVFTMFLTYEHCETIYYLIRFNIIQTFYFVTNINIQIVVAPNNGVQHQG